MSSHPFSFLQSETSFSLVDYDLLKADPKKIIPILLSKKNSSKFLEFLEKANLYSPNKKPARFKPIFKELSNQTISDLLKRFKGKESSSLLLRKVLRKKLTNYENVGFFYREQLWLLASDATFFMSSHKGYYHTLKENFDQSVAPFSNLIEIDLARTSVKFTSEPEKLGKCRDVLSCYAKRNPDIGYCQGLNFLLCELSRHHFTEEEAFWFFTTLIENLLPIDYYSSMIGVLIDQRIFNDLLEELTPRLAQKFRDLSFDTSLFSIQWFVCLFCKSFSGNLLEIVLDNLVISGSRTLFTAGLAMLRILEVELLKAKDFAALLKLIETKSKEICDELYFQQKINEIYISRKVLEITRHFYRQNIEEKQFTVMKDSNHSRKCRTLNLSHQKKLSETKHSCDINSLVCKTLIESNQTFRTNFSSFVFRQSPRLIFTIQEYFGSSLTYQNRRKALDLVKNPKMKEEIELLGMLIGRHHHICKEPTENSPFSPYSPFTPVDFSQIHSFNDKFNEYNQEEKNQSFLKGYLKKSVLETRKSLDVIEQRKPRILIHSKTFDINPGNSKERRDVSIEKDIVSGKLKLSLPIYEIEDDEVNSAFLSHDDVYRRRGKLPKKNEEIKKRSDEDFDENHDSDSKFEARASMLILHAKGVYKNIKEETVDKFIKEIQNSECISFAHEFFIERSKV